MNSSDRKPALPLNTRCAAAVLAALVSSVSAAALTYAGAVYKSVDAQGHVVYSDQPDMSVPQTQVQIAGSDSYADLDLQTQEVPPPLQESDQPPCPVDGYLWTPGFWAWSDSGYYWVAGEWVEPPQVGVLWTPGYWESVDDGYVFHLGYWADEVGYYGGINYGYGYYGVGYAGGRWAGHGFAYNRNVSNLGTRNFRNTYSEAVNNAGHSRVSYNGGRGGTTMVPSSTERARGTASHIQPTTAQRQSLLQAARIPSPTRYPRSEGSYSSSYAAQRVPPRSPAAPPAYVQRSYTPPLRNQPVTPQVTSAHNKAAAPRTTPTSRLSGSRSTLTR